MKPGCQPVAMTTETDRLLPKDNNLKSPQKNSSETSTKIIWILPNGQSWSRSACDEKHTWQETHVTGNASKEHELKFRRRKPKQVQESSRSELSEPITRNIIKKQPIKHLERRGVNKTQKECSAINTAAFGQKVSLFNKTLSVVRSRGCDSLPSLL